ncbi:MAG TPA: BolA family protein [Candidatus Dormibacteraeota bacterium]|nr:BolA family protein [Candidatus Dormibacteraeota bacterium]
MIDTPALVALIRASIPDAQVDVVDRTGTMDHFNLKIRSQAFAGRPLLEQHRLVYGALGDALKDGRVHAVEITTLVE